MFRTVECIKQRDVGSRLQTILFSSVIPVRYSETNPACWLGIKFLCMFQKKCSLLSAGHGFRSSQIPKAPRSVGRDSGHPLSTQEGNGVHQFGDVWDQLLECVP